MSTLARDYEDRDYLVLSIGDGDFYECTECGSVVTRILVHERWHESFAGASDD